MKKLLTFCILTIACVAHGSTLVWNANTDTVTGYNVYIGSASGSEALVATVTVPTYAVPVQVPGTYFAVVKAVNGALISLPSNEVTWVVMPNPLPPTGLHVTSP